MGRHYNFIIMKEAKSLFPKANQTALLYENGRVMLKKHYKQDSAIYTRFEHFIGTAEEVESKIKELGLKDLPPEPEIPKPIDKK
jgi:hypothetical protein